MVHHYCFIFNWLRNVRLGNDILVNADVNIVMGTKMKHLNIYFVQEESGRYWAEWAAQKRHFFLRELNSLDREQQVKRKEKQESPLI